MMGKKKQKEESIDECPYEDDHIGFQTMIIGPQHQTFAPATQYEMARQTMNTKLKHGTDGYDGCDKLRVINKLTRSLSCPLSVGMTGMGCPRPTFAKGRAGPRSQHRAVIDTFNANQQPHNRLVYSSFSQHQAAAGRSRPSGCQSTFPPGALPRLEGLPGKRPKPSLYKSMCKDVRNMGVDLLGEQEAFKRMVNQTLSDEAAEQVRMRKKTAAKTSRVNLWDTRAMLSGGWSESDSESGDEEMASFEVEETTDETQVKFIEDVCTTRVNRNTAGRMNPHTALPSIQSNIVRKSKKKPAKPKQEFSNSDPTKFQLECVHEASGILEALARQWKKKPNKMLEKVVMKNKGISGDAAAALCNAVSTGLPRLCELDLSGNNLTLDSKLFGPALCRMSEDSFGLEELNLTNCCLTNKIVAAMASSLETSPSLRVLNLKRNKLGGNKAMEALGKMIGSQHGLKQLVLSENLIGTSLGYLAAGLEANCTLEEIDLSWNRVNDRGLIGFVGGLRSNTSLLSLDMSHNRIREMGALVLMDALKADNKTLKHCALDFNSLGEVGGRAAAAVKDNAMLGCNITMSHCSFGEAPEGGKGGFNPEDPNGCYELELSTPYDCTVAKKLVDMAYESSIHNMWNLTLDGVPLKLPQESRWQPPKSGLLSFTYVHTFRKPCQDDAISDDFFQMLCLMLDTCRESERQEQLNLRAAEYWFMTSQMLALADKFAFNLDKVEAIVSLFPRVIDLDVLKPLLPTILEPKDFGYLKKNLGALYWFNRDNCSGYYHLNFENKLDRQVMRLLLAVSADEGRRRKVDGLPDISQTGNFEGFRNETMNGEPFLVNSGTYLTQSRGIFKCDFVSYERPPGYVDWMQDHQFDEWFERLVPLAHWFAQDDWVYTEHDDAEDKEMDLNAVLLNSVEQVSLYAGTSKDKQNKKDKPAKQECSVDQITTEEWEFLGWLREESTLPCPCSDDTFVRYVSAEQLGRMLKAIPPHLRTEALVVMWGRLVDEEESKAAFCKLSPTQYLDCFKRIGSLQLFNPTAPEGPYRLDLSLHEHYMVGKLLLRLAMHEPGDNLVGEMYKGMGFETPVTWLTDFPTKGVWEFTYATVDMTDPEDAEYDPNWKYPTSADPEFRKKMAIEDLGWEFDDDDDDDDDDDGADADGNEESKASNGEDDGE